MRERTHRCRRNEPFSRTFCAYRSSDWLRRLSYWNRSGSSCVICSLFQDLELIGRKWCQFWNHQFKYAQNISNILDVYLLCGSHHSRNMTLALRFPNLRAANCTTAIYFCFFFIFFIRRRRIPAISIIPIWFFLTRKGPSLNPHLLLWPFPIAYR